MPQPTVRPGRAAGPDRHAGAGLASTLAPMSAAPAALAAAVAGALAAIGALPAAASGSAADPRCQRDYRAARPLAAAPLRFGIDSEAAGTAGTNQTPDIAPEDPVRRRLALRALRPPGRTLIVRLNRLFWADGEAGIQRFRRRVAEAGRDGLAAEVQVRYRPPAGREGDIAAWTRYVRRAVDVLGRERGLVSLTITNEINLALSPNTSDGAFRGASQALIQGIVAGRREAVRIGRPDLRFGFTYAYRFDPAADAALFRGLRAGGRALRSALGFVGLDMYPGLLVPRLAAGDPGLGAAAQAALATVRRCDMALAGLPRSIPIWVTENGYPSQPGFSTEAQQAAALRTIVGAVQAAAGTYGVTDYRWFNLRDNRSAATGLFQQVGLLRDTYARKPAFGAYRDLIRRLGR